MHFISVDLPEPLGPRMAVTLPPFKAQAYIVQNTFGADVPGQSPGFNHMANLPEY